MTTKKAKETTEENENTNALQVAVEKATDKNINLNDLINSEDVSPDTRRQARKLQDALATDAGVFDKAAASQLDKE